MININAAGINQNGSVLTQVDKPRRIEPNKILRDFDLLSSLSKRYKTASDKYIIKITFVISRNEFHHTLGVAIIKVPASNPRILDRVTLFTYPTITK
jgi:hypothetical protein